MVQRELGRQNGHSATSRASVAYANVSSSQSTDHGVGQCEIAQLAVGIGTLGGGEHPTGHRAPQLWPNTSN